MLDLIRLTLATDHWGQVLVMRPIPRQGNSWGCLEPLRETEWGKLIPVVSGEAFSHAMHGYATPLMNQIGPKPHALLRMVPKPYRVCLMIKTCPLATEHCHPSPKLPDCYDPPGLEGSSPLLASQVAIAWKEGRYVVVVEGDEFSI